MTTWSRFRSWLRAIVGRSRMESEMDAELHFHLDAYAHDLVRSGVPPQEAMQRARLEFGGIERAKEECRDARGMNLLEELLQDVRYGLRVLRKNVGVTLIAIITLALGIGANTTIFSVVSGLLFREPPVSDPDRLMIVSNKNPEKDAWAPDRSPVSAPDFLDWRAQSKALSDMAAADFDTFTLSGGTAPERVAGSRVSSNYFDVLGIAPMFGRVFLPEENEAGHDRVVILSEELWKSRCGGDSKVLDRVVRLNGNPYTVIGVMPASRQLWNFQAQVWVPLVPLRGNLFGSGRNARFLRVFARLKPGVDERQARTEMATIAQRIAELHPDTNKGWGATVMSVRAFSAAESEAGTASAFLMTSVGFVLLIACANLANLLLARNSTRQCEFSIRTVLGAGGLRLARQLLTECLLLSFAGGGLGVLFALFGVRVLRAQLNWSPEDLAQAQQIRIDNRVLVFTLAISALATVLFALVPALQVLRTPGVGLKENSRGTTAGRESHRLQRFLVIGQVALSLVLLVGAGLFVEAFLREIRTEVVLNPRNVLTASVSLRGLEYFDARRQTAFFDAMLRQLDSSSEVQSAAITSDLPFTFPGRTRFTLEGHPVSKPDDQPTAGYYAVSPGYFRTLQIPLLQGREFTPDDNANRAPVVIVDTAFARKYFPNQNPLGNHVRLGTLDPKGAPEKWSKIVGIVQDVDEYLAQKGPRPHIFMPYFSHPSATMNIIVRTHSAPETFADSLRSAVWSVDADQAVTGLRTMSRVVADSEQGDNVMAEVMGAFTVIALLMAAVGIYGVVSYLVRQRLHEIGIRLALGGQPHEVLSLVMRNAMMPVAVGVAIGFALSLALPRVVAASFEGFDAHSLGIVWGAPFVVISAALAACYIPARRASRVDPVVALRYE